MIRLFGNATSTKRLQELRRLALFVDLNTREMKVVDDLMHERRYLRDEVVFDAGEEGQAIYFVLEGRVTICPQGEPENQIASLGRGDSFGELALIDDAPRVAQARAAEDCVLMVLSRGDFLGLMQSHALISSKIALQLARQLSARLRASVRNDGVSV